MEDTHTQSQGWQFKMPRKVALIVLSSSIQSNRFISYHVSVIILRMCVQFENMFEHSDDEDDDKDDDDDDDNHDHHSYLNCTSQRNLIQLLTTLHDKHPIGPMSTCLFSFYNA